MQKYMCFHTLPAGAMTKEQVCDVAEAGQHEQDVRGYRAFINLSEGKACCVIEAKDRDAVIAWFRKMGLPYDEVVPVEFEGEHGTIEDLRREPALAR
jgi:hypothetical protein